MGKPLVVSDCPAQQRLIENEKCGLLHEAGNEVDLADKLNELLSNTEKCKQYGENGKSAVENKWNWDKTSEEMIDLYNQLPPNTTHRF